MENLRQELLELQMDLENWFAEQHPGIISTLAFRSSSEAGMLLKSRSLLRKIPKESPHANFQRLR